MKNESFQMEYVQPIINKLFKGSFIYYFYYLLLFLTNSSTTFLVKCPSRDLLAGNAVINITDTPKKRFLKKIISSLVRENYNQRKKIKVLNQQVKRQKKKQISSLKSMYKMVTTKYVNIVTKISILSITFFIVLSVKVLKENNLINFV